MPIRPWRNRRDPRRARFIGVVPPRQPQITGRLVTGDASIEITFNQPVTLRGLPRWRLLDIAGGPRYPEGANQLGPESIEVFWPGAIVTSSATVNVEANDLAVQNAIGGFLAEQTFPWEIT